MVLLALSPELCWGECLDRLPIEEEECKEWSVEPPKLYRLAKALEVFSRANEAKERRDDLDAAAIGSEGVSEGVAGEGEEGEVDLLAAAVVAVEEGRKEVGSEIEVDEGWEFETTGEEETGGGKEG